MITKAELDFYDSLPRILRQLTNTLETLNDRLDSIEKTVKLLTEKSEKTSE